MTKPLLMLTLPNSGSTWFGETVSRNIEGCRYYPEYFNPLRNPKHEDVLAAHFGCETIASYRHIAEPGNAETFNAIQMTWWDDAYTFTKEIFSPMKLEVFMRSFACFVFLRSGADSFPPTRLRVWSFYEHAWWSLRYRGVKLDARTIRDRALESHSILTIAMLDAAKKNAVPVIWHGDLFRPGPVLRHQLNDVLVECCGQRVDTQQLADDIAATRLILARPETGPSFHPPSAAL